MNGKDRTSTSFGGDVPSGRDKLTMGMLEGDRSVAREMLDEKGVIGHRLILSSVIGFIAVFLFACNRSELATGRSRADLSQFDHIGRFVDGLAPVRKGVMWAY